MTRIFLSVRKYATSGRVSGTNRGSRASRVKEHDAKISEQRRRIESKAQLFSDAFSIQTSQSLSIQPSRERNMQFNLQDGQFLPWKACLQCSCVDVMRGLLYESTHAMVSFPSLLRAVHAMFSLSSLRESSFWLNASSSGSSLLQWRHSSSKLPSGQSHARAPFLPFVLSLARALSVVCWVRARQSVAYRLQSSIVT